LGGGTGGRELGIGGIRGLIKGTGGIHAGGIGGTGGTSRGEAVNGVIREYISESLFESPRSTGDLIAMILVGEMGASSKEIGEDGAEDTRLMTLSCGNTDIPHLLAGRAGAGVNSGGVTGELASDGGEGGGDRVVVSAGSCRVGEVGRLSV